MQAIVFPEIDPVALSIGPIAIHWYALAYLVGIVIGYLLVQRLNARYKTLPPVMYDDLMFYIVLGIIIGGRMGYVLFYDPEYYFQNPIEIIKTYKGGMSFHGGLIGVGLACWLLSRKYRCNFLAIVDMLAVVAPIGIFLGRMANFINRELVGRATDLPWGVVFSQLDGVARHPSQLYEAMCEGVVLFVIMLLAVRRDKLKFHGMIIGIFLSCYGVFRLMLENFREPDAHIGLIASYFTMGQLLSIPMIGLGIFLIFYSKKSCKE